LLINSLAGPDLFKAYCSACHGADGRGNGPAAASLKTPPADLTSLARRSGGAFPQARVQAVLSGDGPAAVAAHGTATMPVWGPIFRALEAGPQAEVRIANLVKYLSSAQRP
jgi:mono/diheme cytochrome c family protein